VESHLKFEKRRKTPIINLESGRANASGNSMNESLGKQSKDWQEVRMKSRTRNEEAYKKYINRTTPKLDSFRAGSVALS